MTSTQTACSGTTALDVVAGIARAAERNIWPPAYGRRMCAVCGGIVFPKADGTLRKHKPGSNVHAR